MLELRGVSKVYGRAAGGRVEALADLTFEVKPTELAVVVGPVGAGKSTLLRLVTGEERPTRGAVLVDGVEVGTLGARGLARLRRSLGVVSQDGQLLPDRTALGNLTFVLRALGAGRAEARDRALAALVEVGLGPVRNALPHELAAGERRRVLLARALAHAARGSCSPTSPRRCSTRRRPRWWGRSSGACRLAEPRAWSRPSRSSSPGRSTGECSSSRPAGSDRRAILSSYLFGATLRGCRRGGATAAAAVLLAALAVLVAGGALAGDLALGLSEAAWRADLRLVVVLRAGGARPEAPDGILARVRALPGVTEVRYVAPAVALAELRRLLGPRGDGLDHLPSNPLAGPARDHAGARRSGPTSSRRSSRRSIGCPG